MNYMQTSGGGSDGFVLEYQAGSIEQHFRHEGPDLSLPEVVRAFQSYASGDDAWQTSIAWAREESGASNGLSAGGPGALVVFLVVAYIAWRLWFL